MSSAKNRLLLTLWMIHFCFHSDEKVWFLWKFREKLNNWNIINLILILILTIQFDSQHNLESMCTLTVTMVLLNTSNFIKHNTRAKNMKIKSQHKKRKKTTTTNEIEKLYKNRSFEPTKQTNKHCRYRFLFFHSLIFSYFTTILIKLKCQLCSHNSLS